MAQAGTATVALVFDAAKLSRIYPSLSRLVSKLLTQYGVKQGLDIFAKKGDYVDAVSAKMLQLHDFRVMEPKSPASLTQKEQRDALYLVIFLKKKEIVR